MEINLQQILDDEGFSYSQTKTHIVLKDCPACNGKNKLYVDQETHLWTCFKCRGQSKDTLFPNEDMNTKGYGNLYSLLLNLGFTKQYIMQFLGSGQAPSYFDDTFDFKSIEDIEEVPEKNELDFFQMPFSFYPLDCTEQSFINHLEAYEFIKSRKVVNKNIIINFDLRYSFPMKRLIFPIYNKNSLLVGWQGRDITDKWKKEHPRCMNDDCSLKYRFKFGAVDNVCDECGQEMQQAFYPKSLNSKGFDKNQVLFNENNVNWNKPVILVEGPFDCINCPNSVAILGKFLSPYQLKTLYQNAQEVVIYFDGDDSGKQSTLKVSSQLSPLIERLSVIQVDDGKDPGCFNILENIESFKKRIDIESWSINKKILYI